VLVDALMLVRLDAEEPLNVRDFHQLGVGALLAQAQNLLPRSGLGSEAIPGTRTNPGRRGYPDGHWRHVLGLWENAQRVAPRRPLAWMCEQFPDTPTSPRPSRGTMERWRNIAVKRLQSRQ
jgi:hypothetical protein